MKSLWNFTFSEVTQQCNPYVGSWMHGFLYRASYINSSNDSATSTLLNLMKSASSLGYTRPWSLSTPWWYFLQLYKTLNQPTQVSVQFHGSTFGNWLSFEMGSRPGTFRVSFLWKMKHSLQDIFCSQLSYKNRTLIKALTHTQWHHCHVSGWGYPLLSLEFNGRPRRRCKCKQVRQDVAHPRNQW